MGYDVALHPSGYVDNGANRYDYGSAWIRVAIYGVQGNSYLASADINGVGWQNNVGWDGTYFYWYSGGPFRGGNPGTGYAAYSSKGYTWSGGMGGYSHWYYNTPGAPNAPSVSRSSNGATLYAATGGGSGRITYYNVALYGVTGWNANGTTFNVDPYTTYSVGSLAGNEDNSIAGGTTTSYGICNAPTGTYANKSTSVAGRIDAGITTAPTYVGAGVSSYKIFRDGTLIQNTSSASVADTGLTRGQTYTYTVKAVNSTGDGAVSVSASAMAPGVPSAPGVPTVSSKIGRNVTVNSTRGSTDYGNAISEYRIQLSTDNGSTWSGWDNTTKAFTANGTYNILDSSGNFAYTLLSPALTYKWRVYAVNSIGTGDVAVSASGLFVSSGGKRWDGTQYKPTEIARRYTGSAWTDITIAKRYNGSTWVDLT